MGNNDELGCIKKDEDVIHDLVLFFCLNIDYFIKKYIVLNSSKSSQRREICRKE